MNKKVIYASIVKPVSDRVVALLLLILFFPVLTVIAVVLHFKYGKSFFYQERPGKRGISFRMIKFRTMDDNGRVINSLLRKTSIDELPQLVNVLKGEMSLVGPRPLLEEYLPYYTQEEKRRHEVLPGITGWSQVHGRNESDWARRMEDDLYYVDHFSFTLDLKIIVKTFIELLNFKKADFNQLGKETFVEFAIRRNDRKEDLPGSTKRG